MKLHAVIRIFLCVALLTHFAAAFETDQYNLPRQPLADIGDEVAEYVDENLHEAAAKLNAEIAEAASCRENCAAAEKRLVYLRSEEALARAVYKLLGAGIVPTTKSGTWMNSHKFRAQPARYKTSYNDSIYRILPTNYFTISPTVNLYGSEFGTDKIAHLFQQGYEYYAKYRRLLKKGASRAEALKKTVDSGKFSERTYFGTFVSGVYSNADLAANFIGLKFYEGLTQVVEMGDGARPPVFSLKDGVWKFNANANGREMLLRPFISNHLNEALNPSKYSFFLRSSVRRVVRDKSCKAWRERYPERTAKDFEDITRGMRLWYGADYGYSASENFVTIAGTCFGK